MTPRGTAKIPQIMRCVDSPPQLRAAPLTYPPQALGAASVAVHMAQAVRQKFVTAAKVDKELAAEQPDLVARVKVIEEALSGLLDVEGSSPHVSSLVLSAREQLKASLLLIEGLSKPLAKDAYAKLFKNQNKQRAKMRAHLKVTVDRLVMTAHTLTLSTKIKSGQDGRGAAAESDDQPETSSHNSTTSSVSTPTIAACPAGSATERFWTVALGFADAAATTWPDFKHRLEAAMTSAGGALDLSGVPTSTRDAFWDDLKCALMPNAGEVVTLYALEDFVQTCGSTESGVEAALEKFLSGQEQEVDSTGDETSRIVAEEAGGDDVRPRKLLWIDDRPENNEDIVSKAMQAGVDVECASSVREGYEKLVGYMRDTPEIFIGGAATFRVITDNVQEIKDVSDEVTETIMRASESVVEMIKGRRIATSVMIYCDYTLPTAQEIAEEHSNDRVVVRATRDPDVAETFACFSD